MVKELLYGYKRFGDEPNHIAFLAKYWGDNKWKYPPNDGFVGEPSMTELQPGDVVDRFGGPSGTFLALIGTPFEQRSLPPQSLNTCEYEPNVWQPNGYYRYKVELPITVLSGITAGWFGQPGGGTQLKILTPVGAPERWNVAWLVKNNYLTPIVG
ncbi:hypothetical protein A6A25_13720 [Saccharothrix sp. CB00851]|nr:hypothetical protein A6A25_13720 [Saccharothrix sp. CB00851]